MLYLYVVRRMEMCRVEYVKPLTPYPIPRGLVNTQVPAIATRYRLHRP
jgi:hypothetical protein